VDVHERLHRSSQPAAVVGEGTADHGC
jgi:hypothetical protein